MYTAVDHKKSLSSNWLVLCTLIYYKGVYWNSTHVAPPPLCSWRRPAPPPPRQLVTTRPSSPMQLETTRPITVLSPTHGQNQSHSSQQKTTAGSSTTTTMLEQSPPTFTASPGVIPIMEGKEPVDFFRLMLDEQVVDHILDETSRYALQYLEKEKEHLASHPNARAHD